MHYITYTTWIIIACVYLVVFYRAYRINRRLNYAIKIIDLYGNDGYKKLLTYNMIFSFRAINEKNYPCKPYNYRDDTQLVIDAFRLRYEEQKKELSNAVYSFTVKNTHPDKHVVILGAPTVENDADYEKRLQKMIDKAVEEERYEDAAELKKKLDSILK